MASFWGELKRRNVVKVGAAYAVLAWLLIQIASTVLPTFGAPDWVGQTFTFLLFLAFPVVLLITWAFEITPEGVKKTAEIPLESSIGQMSGQKLNYVITGVLALAVVFMGIDNYVLRDVEVPAAGNAAFTAGPESVVDAGQNQPANANVLPNSIAVLPFANLSPDPENDYFAAGIHEEILNQLVKLRNLNVIARTSVLQYADAARPITEIARELNVGTVMEGSVSYADDRVAVAAQLIDAETGVHLWSERYNTAFANVFDIQADIAMNIANALRAEFSGEEQARLERRPTESTAAYSYFLRSLVFPASERFLAIDLLDRAIDIDSEFADAYGQRALRYSYRGRGAADLDVDWERLAREDAERALELNPELAIAYAALGDLSSYNQEWADAERLLETALQLSPRDSRIVESYATFKRDTGDYLEAIRWFRRCVELDPASGCENQTAITQRYAKEYETSIATISHIVEYAPTGGVYLHLALGRIAIGEIEGALEDLRTAEQMLRTEQFGGNSATRLAQLALGYKHVNRQQDVERLFEELRNQDTVSDATWAMAYMARGDYDEARSRLVRALDAPRAQSLMSLGQIKANDLADPILDGPEWQALRDRINAL